MGRLFHKWIMWIRFGKITEHTIETLGEGTPSQIEYRDRRGRVIGFWAYGSYAPNLPIQEESWW